MRRNHFVLIAIVIAAAFLAAAIYILTAKPFGGSSEYSSSITYPTSQTTLKMWLPQDEKGNFDQLVEEYEQAHPAITIELEYIETAQYQTRLLEAITNATLPDLFVFRNDGLPLYKRSLALAPSSVIDIEKFEKTFVPFAQERLTNADEIYGMPLGLATLGLIYNTQSFSQSSAGQPPKDWSEFEKTNNSLRKRDGTNLLVSGVALGTPTVRNSTDIISVLMIQNGATMTDNPPTKATFNSPDSQGYASGAKALAYYASFASPTKANYSWSAELGDSVSALAQNKTALIVDYPMAYKLVRAQNSTIPIATAALPQNDAENPTNYGIIQTGGVAKTSQYTELAWDFWAFASSKASQKTFATQSYWPSARKDLSEEQKNDRDLKPFAEQTQTATDWYKGVNYLTNSEFATMTQNYLNGFDPQIVVNNGASKVTQSIQASYK